MNKIKKIIFELIWAITPREKRSQLVRRLGVEIGGGCAIYRNVEFGSEPYLIHIGEHVRITNGVKFCTHDGGMWVLRKLYPDMAKADCFGEIHIGNNVHIGWNTIIMPGVNIGDNCVIGCGSIVTKDIPENSIAVGVPARKIKSIESYYEAHRENVIFTANMSEGEKRQLLTKGQ